MRTGTALLVRRGALCWVLLPALLPAGLAGCTGSYIEQVARVSAAEVGATERYRWAREHQRRFVPATSVYVAVASTFPPPPSTERSRTFRDFEADDLPWRLARVVADGWRGPFATLLGRRPETLTDALGTARLAGAQLVVMPSLQDDGGPRGLWHRDSLTVELQVFATATGEQVERIELSGRRALDAHELAEAGLVDALRDLGAEMTGQPGRFDHRLDHVF